MKTPAELINDASTALGRMANECAAIHDYASLLSVLMAGPDAESAMAGMQRVALNIRGLGRSAVLSRRCNAGRAAAGEPLTSPPGWKRR